jgi:hypothetical protein
MFFFAFAIGCQSVPAGTSMFGSNTRPITTTSQPTILYMTNETNVITNISISYQDTTNFYFTNILGSDTNVTNWTLSPLIVVTIITDAYISTNGSSLGGSSGGLQSDPGLVQPADYQYAIQYLPQINYSFITNSFSGIGTNITTNLVPIISTNIYVDAKNNTFTNLINYYGLSVSTNISQTTFMTIISNATTNLSITNTNIAGTSIPLQGTVVLNVLDPMNDDNGAGELTYPQAYPAGCLDINQFVMSADSTNIYFYVALRSRVYVDQNTAAKSPGFKWLFLGAYFGQSGAPISNGKDQYLGTCSPGDGLNWNQAPSLAPLIRTTNVSIKYSVCMIGAAYPIIGAIVSSGNFFENTLGMTNGLYKLITTNNLIPTPVAYPNVSTVLAFWIPRGTNFTSGNWYFTAFSHGWEDYGYATACPGENGYLREVYGASSEYQFGDGGDGNISRYSRCCDLLCTNGISQTNLLQPIDSSIVQAKNYNVMWDKDFFPIVLP